jgi:hypothetical protein
MLRRPAVPRLPARLLLALLTSVSTTARARADVAIAWLAEGDAACTKPPGAESQVARLARAPLQRAFEVRCAALLDGAQRCVLRVQGQEARSERVLASCDEAREAMILLMAMAEAPASLAAPTAHAPEADEAPSAAAGKGARWLLSTAALIDTRSLPGIAAGPALSVSFAAGLWRLGLGARYLAPRSVSGLPPGVGADIDLFAGSVSPALIWRRGAWGIGPRAELELGVLRGRARGVEERAPANALWLAATGGVALELWVHARIGLELAALVGAPLRRPRFGFLDEAPFFTAASYLARGTLGLIFRIDAKD